MNLLYLSGDKIMWWMNKSQKSFFEAKENSVMDDQKLVNFNKRL